VFSVVKNLSAAWPRCVLRGSMIFLPSRIVSVVYDLGCSAAIALS